MKALRALVLMVAGWLAAGAAQALCLGPVCSCSVSTTPVAFGSHNPLGGATDSTGSVRVNCSGVAGLLIPYSISLSTGGAGGYGPRRMGSGANTLAYNLYSDPTRSSVWGDGSGGSAKLSSSVLLDVLGLSPLQTHTVYGRIPAGQTAAVPGSYADTITVTITYE